MDTEEQEEEDAEQDPRSDLEIENQLCAVGTAWIARPPRQKRRESAAAQPARDRDAGEARRAAALSKNYEVEDEDEAQLKFLPYFDDDDDDGVISEFYPIN
ncbi:hypothetical protein BBJ28_00021357 [Nothophytophthora sp. Chile5]|nr:hypothetical protein BBJ28_00021357 [Nothophytophthora sp. Chile5]